MTIPRLLIEWRRHRTTGQGVAPIQEAPIILSDFDNFKANSRKKPQSRLGNQCGHPTLT